jgi:hypothetical protein
MTTTEQIIALVAQYDRLLEAVETAGTDFDSAAAEWELENFLRDYPGIPDYDNRGNYIGSVRNENGWTP